MKSTKPQWTLAQADAERLIGEMKNAIDHEFTMPAPGEQNHEFQVIGPASGTIYVIAPFRGQRNPRKHSISARIGVTGVQLMRLCVNGSPHTNPDGTIVPGTHLHVYREGHDARTAYALPIDSPDFVSDTILLLKQFNVITMPAFQDGIEAQL